MTAPFSAPRSFTVVFASVVLALFLRAPPVWSSEDPEPPPVRRVVLYKHGMGYLEREGRIFDDASVTLSFRPDQMKDLLTSFFAVDLGGGRITSVRYETREPAAKRIQDIPISVPDSAALSQFLQRLQGVRLTGRAGGEAFEGRVLGTEPLSETVGGQAVRTGYRLVLLSDGGSVRSVDLYALSDLTIADEALRRDLDRLLDVTLDAKRSSRRRLVVAASGKGERNLRLGYLLEMPVWKSSYRVLFDPKDRERALLQGWALAENTTEDDWRDVELSFVAGNPLAYSMDLYSPYYVKRPEVPIPGLAAAAVDWKAAPAPEAAAKSVSRARAGFRAEAPPRPAVMEGMMAAQAMDQAAPAPAGVSQDLLAESAGPVAEGARVGELFAYQAPDRVSIPSGQAAMVPITSERIEGKRVLFYKAALSPKPVNAFVLRNHTELTLDAGAVTFFEEGTSLGEGILGHTLPPGSQEVIPYAVDASVDVTPQVSAEREPYSEGRIVDGVLTLRRTETLTTTWKITNRGRETVAVWLDHPKNAAYALSKPEKPLKETDNHYRFEVSVKGGETADFAVEERRPLRETVALAATDETAIRAYASARYLSEATRKFLAEVGDLMARRTTLQRQAREWEQQTRRLAEEQERLRSNLKTTYTNQPKEQELRSRWMSFLASTEEKLADLRVKLDDAGEKVRRLEEDLAAKVRGYRGE